MPQGNRGIILGRQLLALAQPALTLISFGCTSSAKEPLQPPDAGDAGERHEKNDGGIYDAGLDCGGCNNGFVCITYFPGGSLKYCYESCSLQQVGRTCGGTGAVCAKRTDGAGAACFVIVPSGQKCIPEVCDASSFCVYDEQQGPSGAVCRTMCTGDQDCSTHSQCVRLQEGPAVCVPK
jgi:hypothetical protein